MALAVLAVLVAPVVALVSALTHGWAPHGDDATIALRSADVLDGRLPLTGMRSTSGDGGHPELASHHPGPLEFYLLALPMALTGGSAVGVVLGCALLAAVASVLVVVWARRLGGSLAVVVLTAGLLLTQWVIGPEAMIRPFNPYPPLLPTYLALVLLWALARGHHRALPPFVVAVSLLAQANLSYLALALTLAVGAAALLVRDRRVNRPRRTRARRLSHRWAIGLAVLAWLPSVAELLLQRPNNLTQVWRYTTSGAGDSVGLAAGAQHLSLLAPFAGGFRHPSNDLLTQGSTAAMATGGVILLLLAAIATGWHVPQGRASSVWPARVALLANVGMLVTASQLPEWPAAPYWIVTWLPVAAFTWVALAWRALAYLEDLDPRLPARVALPLGGALVALALTATVTAPDPHWEENASLRAVGELTADELGPGEGQDVQIEGLGFVPTLAAGPAVAWQLHREGWNPHYMLPWPHQEDADHLWSTTAVPGSTTLYLTDSEEPELTSDLPEEAERLGEVELGYRPGTVTVYLVRAA